MSDRDIFSFKEEDFDVILTVRTLAPTKWLLMDRETGQMYQGNLRGHWDRLEPVIKVDGENDVW
jgi:hypothetical protein